MRACGGHRESPRRGGAGGHEDLSKRVDALFAPWDQGATPGAAVLVAQAGAVLHMKGYGLADLAKHTPVGEDTSFLLASVTKPFTAMAIMVLAERGTIDYEDTLSNIFPQFRGLARTIRVRELLWHTSGLPYYEDALIDAGLLDPDDYWPRSVKVPKSKKEPTSQQTLEALALQGPLRFKPGDRFEYSNAGYVVLGQIVAAASGVGYPRFMKKAIFNALGMRHSLVYDEHQPTVPRRATSYTWDGTGYQDIDYTPLNYVYGEDGIYTTIRDMVRWHEALLLTGKPVTPASLERAFTSGTTNKGEDIRYGFGWDVRPDYVCHDGAWLGFRTYIFHHLARNLSVVVLANCAELNAASLGMDVAALYV